MQTELSKDLHIDDVQYGVFYTVYSWTNCIFCLLGGPIVDLTTNRLGAMIFITLVLVGQCLLAIGASVHAYWLMILARCLIGMGLGNVTIVKNNLINVFFDGKEVTFSFGITMTVARIGSVINFFVSPTLVEKIGYVAVLWIGAVVCGVSWVSALVFGFLELNAEKKGMIHSQKDRKRLRAMKNAVVETIPPPVTSPSSSQATSTASVGASLVPSSDIAMTQPLQQESTEIPPSDTTPTLQMHHPQTADGLSSTQRKSRCAKLGFFKGFSVSFWLLCFVCGFYHINIFAMYAVIVDLLKKLFNYTPFVSGVLASIIYMTSIPGSLIVGVFVDHFGIRAILLIIACVINLLFDSWVAFTDWNPIGPLVFVGISYSIVANVIWTSIAVLIDPTLVGTGNSIMTCVQMLFVGIANLVVGVITREFGYKTTMIFFLGSTFFALVIMIFVELNERIRNHNKLDSFVPEATRKKKELKKARKMEKAKRRLEAKKRKYGLMDEIDEVQKEGSLGIGESGGEKQIEGEVELRPRKAKKLGEMSAYSYDLSAYSDDNSDAAEENAGGFEYNANNDWKRLTKDGELSSGMRKRNDRREEEDEAELQHLDAATRRKVMRERRRQRREQLLKGVKDDSDEEADERRNISSQRLSRSPEIDKTRMQHTIGSTDISDVTEEIKGKNMPNSSLVMTSEIGTISTFDLSPMEPLDLTSDSSYNTSSSLASHSNSSSIGLQSSYYYNEKVKSIDLAGSMYFPSATDPILGNEEDNDFDTENNDLNDSLVGQRRKEKASDDDLKGHKPRKL
eukprot:MONOS_1997.1-p1 / transcript=MONOS_1997.1 / gene=MONOS_1997 / organism=Monocercomonoides_exilis_PA203 / gene_product=major facilitator superfamily domain containing protein / transcript_product=major facilitator superfamily domain containing protein / location=Mono_scaffold00038:124691-128303(+) / protein_length=792 / sequence_SO=supercontig / SO=protein_coding / is_pseudo=false